MELLLNLDKIQSESVSQYAKDILDNQNPYKNFKIENYKYAQLHKDVKSEILLRDINFSKLLDNNILFNTILLSLMIGWFGLLFITLFE